MASFRNIPIKKKLTMVIAGTTGLTLLLAFGTLFFFEQGRIRESIQNNVLTLANFLAEAAQPSLDFNQPEGATSLLSSLKSQPNITQAVLYRPDHSVFAEWSRSGGEQVIPRAPSVDNVLAKFSEGRFMLFKTIWSSKVEGEKLGILFLEQDLEPLIAATRFYAVLVVAILMASLMVALLISTRFQRFISLPILKLAETAQVIAERKDYSVRAGKISEDEIGLFTDTFNQMLTQIQEQDRALRLINDELEHRVLERTRELTMSNSNLQSALALLKATLESTVDGILVVDRSGKVVTYNQKFCDMWRVPVTLLQKGEDKNLLNHVTDQMQNPGEFLAKVQELYDHPEAESHDTLLFHDGRIFERYSQPHRVEGRSVGRVWSFRDITDRERVARELRERTDKLQRFQNITVSRELQMVKLKEEVNGLLSRSGLPPKYQAPERIRTLAGEKL